MRLMYVCFLCSNPSKLGILAGKLHGLRLLRLMRVIWSGIDFELGQLLPTKLCLGQHPLHRLLENPFRVSTVQYGFGVTAFDTAGITGMPVIDLVGPLVACQPDFFGIDDHNIVAAIYMGREHGFVLAAQPVRHNDGEPAQYKVFGIDKEPFAVHIRRLSGICIHCLH